MGTLADAVQAADERKQALFGGQLDGTPRFEYPDGPMQDRALFSGFDLDYDELRAIATRVGHMMWHGTATMPVPVLMTSAWCEGLLVGLLAARLAAESDAQLAEE